MGAQLNQGQPCRGAGTAGERPRNGLEVRTGGKGQARWNPAAGEPAAATASGSGREEAKERAPCPCWCCSAGSDAGSAAEGKKHGSRRLVLLGETAFGRANWAEQNIKG